jgi:hypothetical protein
MWWSKPYFVVLLATSDSASGTYRTDNKSSWKLAVFPLLGVCIFCHPRSESAHSLLTVNLVAIKSSRIRSLSPIITLLKIVFLNVQLLVMPRRVWRFPMNAVCDLLKGL